MKGNISLNSLKIRPNALDAFNLPFRVVHGHIGHIEIVVPWASLYASPVVCKLSDVHLLAVPNTGEVQLIDYKERHHISLMLYFLLQR